MFCEHMDGESEKAGGLNIPCQLKQATIGSHRRPFPQQRISQRARGAGVALINTDNSVSTLLDFSPTVCLCPVPFSLAQFT
jgi:hypothetical protein